MRAPKVGSPTSLVLSSDIRLCQGVDSVGKQIPEVAMDPMNVVFLFVAALIVAGFMCYRIGR